MCIDCREKPSEESHGWEGNNIEKNLTSSSCLAALPVGQPSGKPKQICQIFPFKIVIHPIILLHWHLLELKWTLWWSETRLCAVWGMIWPLVVLNHIMSENGGSKTSLRHSQPVLPFSHTSCGWIMNLLVFTPSQTTCSWWLTCHRRAFCYTMWGLKWS